MSKESTELVVLQKLEVVPFFTKGDQLDDILQAIAKEAKAHVPDLSTVKSRGEITKNITDIVTASKTYLENSGKDLSAEYKAMPKVIDANRKKCRDFLSDLQVELRKPLTDWEAEQARIKEEERLAEEAKKLKEQIESDHEMALLMNEKFDREAEEARIAEEKAEADRIAKAEADRLEREEQIRREAEEKAKRDAKEAAEKARQEEKQRQEQQRQAEEKAKADREANLRHAAGVHRQAVKDIMLHLCCDEHYAKKIVTAIAKKQIRNITVNY